MSGQEEFLTLKDGAGGMKELLLMHLRKISELTCKEFTPSFWSKKPVKVGDGVAIVETYHPDTRMAYCNAIDFLIDIMMPKADKPFLEKIKGIRDAEELQFKSFKENKGTQDSWVWTKLEFRRKIFGQLILLIDRAKMFSSTLSMSDGQLAELLEEEEDKERDRVNWEDSQL